MRASYLECYTSVHKSASFLPQSGRHTAVAYGTQRQVVRGLARLGAGVYIRPRHFTQRRAGKRGQDAQEGCLARRHLDREARQTPRAGLQIHAAQDGFQAKAFDEFFDDDH